MWGHVCAFLGSYGGAMFGGFFSKYPNIAPLLNRIPIQERQAGAFIGFLLKRRVIVGDLSVDFSSNMDPSSPSMEGRQVGARRGLLFRRGAICADLSYGGRTLGRTLQGNSLPQSDSCYGGGQAALMGFPLRMGSRFWGFIPGAIPSTTIPE